MPAIIAAVVSWLKGRFGTVIAAAAFWLLEKAWARITKWWANYTYWREREARQKEAAKKVEDDVQTGKPRNEETDKNEEDWLNS